LTSLLEVSDLVVGFGDAFRIGPVSLAMDCGALYMEGPNGGGKTTLMRTLAGELVPSSGTVRIRGLDIHRSAAARRSIALVPSAAELPDFLSVAEACEFSAAIRGVKRWDGRSYLDQLDLDPRLPLGSASAGQRRKAELVCGLAGDPEVLLLDETFAHLDQHSVETLSRWVTEWSDSRLVAFAHHGRPPVTPDAVLHIAQGRVDSERPAGNA
jgi:ABC-2 type transport system ATP-binding protein